MEQELESLKTGALAAIAAAGDESALEQARIDCLGKKSQLTALSGRMREVPPEQKAAVGAKLNEVRTAITAALDAAQAKLTAAKDAAAVAGIDVTLPGRPQWRGGLHPLTQIHDRAVQILRRMGFALADGPEIETEWHCFDALNTPADHPARNEQDTFYFPDGRLLRTHTSHRADPHHGITAAAGPHHRAGRAYRRDEIDATHLSAFHQIEGLYVAEHVALSDLKGTLEFFFRALFGTETQLPLPPALLPVHRTQLRDRHQTSRRWPGPALDRNRRLRHGRSRRLRSRLRQTRRPASTPKSSPASPSAWASIASP